MHNLSEWLTFKNSLPIKLLIYAYGNNKIAREMKISTILLWA